MKIASSLIDNRLCRAIAFHGLVQNQELYAACLKDGSFGLLRRDGFMGAIWIPVVDLLGAQL